MNAPKAPMAGGIGIGMNKVERKDDDNKFQRNMDWGTPRLVTKNRALVMDTK